jgi:hypothetical protein
MNKIILHIKIFFVVLLVYFPLHAQQKEEREGTVTYISSQNIYVKFENTDGISAGDTLFYKSGGRLIPSVRVNHISSRSCAGELINGGSLKIDDKIYALAAVKEVIITDIEKEKIAYFDSLNAELDAVKKIKSEAVEKRRTAEDYKGRFSVQSYTNLSNFDSRGEYQRWRYTVSFTGNNIAGSDFSLTNYMTFAYKAQDWSNVSSNPGRHLRIYDLSVKYNFNETTNLRLGRHINRRISNIGAVDGVQFEKIFNNFTAGVIAGSRPDFTNNMGVNFKLFEYGGYIGRTDSINNSVMDNNLAVVQQTNDFETDRRFLYFQHTNNLLPKTHLFLSTEIDLYKKIQGVESTEFILTGMFLSARYAPIREASFSLSYDARKNVIYYETFRSFIDSVFENETRHGLRFGTNIRPVTNLSIGLNAGYRFMKGDVRPSSNFNGNVNYSRVPFIEASTTLSYTQIRANYLDGSIWALRLAKDLAMINSNLSVTYRYTSYDLLSRSGQVIQNSLLTDLSFRIFKNFHLNIGYEGIFEQSRTSGRILMDITTRF